MTIRHPYFTKFDAPTLPVTFTKSLSLDTFSKDALNPGKQYYTNPTLPVPPALTWTETNTYLISKDSKVFGRVYVLNPPIGPTKGQDYTASVNLNLIAVNNPFISKRTEVPLGSPPNPFWINYLNPPAFPTVQQRYEVPLGPPPNPYWINFLNPPGLPTVQQRDEVPLGPTTNPSFVNFIIPAGQDVLPKNQYSWPVPAGPVKGQDYTLSSNPNLYLVVVNPKISQVTFVPTGPSTNPYWIDFTIPAGQDSTVFGRTYLTNPTLPVLPNKDWQDFIIPAGQDFLPFRQRDWPLPTPAALPKVQDWIWDLNPNLVVVINPEVSQVFFVPTGPTTNPFWTSFIVPAGQDKLPINQYSWPVPKGPYFPDQTFYQYVKPQVPLPPGQHIFLVPTGPTSNPTYTAFIVPAGQDQLPVGDQRYNVPPGPLLPINTWSQSFNLPSFQVITLPYNQYSWPNPGIPLRNPADWINFLTNIPPPIPPPPGPIGGGRYITEAEVEAELPRKWRYKEGMDTVYRHMAAVNLGRKGGIESGKSRRGR